MARHQTNTRDSHQVSGIYSTFLFLIRARARAVRWSAVVSIFCLLLQLHSTPLAPCVHSRTRPHTLVLCFSHSLITTLCKCCCALSTAHLFIFLFRGCDMCTRSCIANAVHLAVCTAHSYYVFSGFIAFGFHSVSL